MTDTRGASKCLDPNLELAAEAGDPTAMRMLGWHLHVTAGSASPDSPGEEWLRRAAEAGDTQALRLLIDLYTAREEDARWEKERWMKRSAESGVISHMEYLADNCTGWDHARLWLRRAAEAGSARMVLQLAVSLGREGEVVEAEYWYQIAVDRDIPHARCQFGAFLTAQGRFDEAERTLRQEAENDCPISVRDLAALLVRQGRNEEAHEWTVRAAAMRVDGRPRLRVDDEARSPGPPVLEVVMTAVIATAVVPFIQSLVSKIADDTYAQARQMIGRLLRRGDRRTDEEGQLAQGSGESPEDQPGLAVVRDTEAGITLYLWSNASDEALRALSALNFDDLAARRPDQGQVRLVWNPASRTWHLRGD
ncbi:hypothetical protein ACFWGR_19380 [Streptomyces sp. NPDC060311]|uniref:hypothetical protein n=1 Tax=Streptomyces sp. NPDC060311 TaxID=3347096 RepID=UPI00364E27BC